MQHIILGGGCFWCTESVFLSLKGVQSVVSGYAGGTAQTADYETVCTGQTGHVEVIDVTFDSTEKEKSETVDVDIYLANKDPKTGRAIFKRVKYKFELVN